MDLEYNDNQNWITNLDNLKILIPYIGSKIPSLVDVENGTFEHDKENNQVKWSINKLNATDSEAA